jgi:hypothetical protein
MTPSQVIHRKTLDLNLDSVTSLATQRLSFLCRRSEDLEVGVGSQVSR